MDIYLNKEKVNYVKSVLSTSLAHEETMEMIVPDALPDILRIVDTDATVFLRSKSTDNGRVSVSGVAATTVIYCPEGESGVRKMELEIPFTASANEGEINQNTKVAANVSVSSADASMINPRKIVARVDLLTELTCYNDAELFISSGLEEDGDAGIELLTDSFDIFTTTGIKEKTFVISDELTVPAANPPVGEILKYRVAVTPEDTKVVGSKLILRGTLNISLLYNPQGGGELAKSDFSSEFSQIIELDNAMGDSGFGITLMLTNAYFDCEQSPHNPEGRTIIMEIHAVAQCITSERKTISYISDMYSTKFKLEQETTDYFFDSKNISKTGAVFHGVMETPTPVARVIALNTHSGAVMSTPQPNGALLRAPIFVSALYVSDDGRAMSCTRQYDVEANAEMNPNAKCSANASCGKDVYGVGVGNGIELRIPVDITVTESAQKQVKSLSGLSYDDTTPLDNTKAPSLVVYRAAKGDSLWKLAKKHSSTSRLILAANGIEKEENVNAGQLLIIPKKR
ncbi:LysM repeat-containing protein [Sporobacter termitidis DSM 10068]|uniref:LysM repeat-containing protein n=1 Tax=Sporobacter termitidis DSM 10068 TaxID=1123282 RepID=A0A1M5TH16_9FIRM|nr:SPOCS domain-containing protein [Sporobacter termitidis]SHH49951.1 LysM repeat-containing protein [Sporobacter termitidis DSM 10068]